LGKEFFIHKELYLPWGPFNLLYNGYQGLFLSVKKPAYESDHSPPPKADDKNM